MTENKRFCKNCKHLQHDGMFGIFCGLLGGNNKNYDCSKYEEKISKRFKLSMVALNNPNAIRDNGEPLTQKQVVEILNSFADENGQLKEENKRLKTLKRCYYNNLESYVEALHEEYDKADGDLKAALSVVLSKKYNCEELELR